MSRYTVTLKSNVFEGLNVGDAPINMIASGLDAEQFSQLLIIWATLHPINAVTTGQTIGRDMIENAAKLTQSTIVNLLLGILSGLGEATVTNMNAYNVAALQTCRWIKELLDSNQIDASPRWVE